MLATAITFREITACRIHWVDQRALGMESSILPSVWQQCFHQTNAQNEVEKALYDHLQAMLSSSSNASRECLHSQLTREIQAKRTYMSSTWGYFEAANIGENAKRS